MKILLIFPPKCFSTKEPLPPLGLLYIASALKKAEAFVHVIDSALEKLNYNDIKKLIKNHKPDIVGTTSFTEFRFESFRLLSIAKEVSKDIITMIGGPHVSLTPENTMEYQKDIDILIKGEGEISTVNVYKTLEKGSIANLKDVLGISYRYNDNIYHNEPQPLITDIDNIPFPARELLPMERYNFRLMVPGRGKCLTYHIMTSRGCPFACSFCATSRLAGRKWRARSPENIIEEVRLLLDKYKSEVIWFYDDTFNMKRDRLLRICELIIGHDLKFNFTCSLRLDLADRELLEKLKQAGCFSVFYGIETSPDIASKGSMGKKLDYDKIEENSKILDELNIIKLPSYIIGFPGETHSDASKTIEYMKKHGGKPALSYMRIYPGTEIEDIAKTKNIIPKDFNWASPNEDRCFSLHAAHGSTPIFLDKMTFREISDLSLEWAEFTNIPIYKKIPQALKSIRRPKDLFSILVLGKNYFSRKIKRIFYKK